MTVKAQVGIAAAIRAKTGIARDLENLPETMRERVVASKDALARTQAIKPDGQHANLEALFDGPRCELFAREKRDGWDAWGNQTDKFGGGE